MIKLLWHVARYGHSVDVNRDITVAISDQPKGWPYKCECGKVVAR